MNNCKGRSLLEDFSSSVRQRKKEEFVSTRVVSFAATNNKVIKPHNGPSAILNLIAIGYCVVDDATGTGFYGFGINGSLVSNWL